MPTAAVIDVVLHHKSGLPRDDNVNRFVVADPAVSDPAVLGGAFCIQLETFYGVLASFLAPCFDRGTNHQEMKVYDLPSASLSGLVALGSPVLDHQWTMPAPGSGTGLPSEVALVVSYHADLTGVPVESGTTRPASRKHGRIFVGPLNIGIAATDGTTGETQIVSGSLTTIGNAAAALRDSGTSNWRVWSRANAALYPVTAGWVDNSFDTQRRRGITATARHIF